MSKYDIPTDAAIKRGALKNKAVQKFIKQPLPDCAALCTEAAILEGRPVVMVFAYGYISTSAFDAEDGGTQNATLGELVEIRPLEPDDEFHPEKVLTVIDVKKFPRTNRAGHRTARDAKSEKPAKAAKQPKADKPKEEPKPVAFTDDGDDDLAAALGLEG